MVSVVDLFLLECLSKFEMIRVHTLMIENMYKIIHIKEGKHRMTYGYL